LKLLPFENETDVEATICDGGDILFPLEPLAMFVADLVVADVEDDDNE